MTQIYGEAAARGAQNFRRQKSWSCTMLEASAGSSRGWIRLLLRAGGFFSTTLLGEKGAIYGDFVEQP